MYKIYVQNTVKIKMEINYRKLSFSLPFMIWFTGLKHKYKHSIYKKPYKYALHHPVSGLVPVLICRILR